MKRRLAWLGTATLLAACGGEQPAGPSAGRGRIVYQTNCIACHNPDPTQQGTLGPALAGSPRELVEARVTAAAYPPGYKPQRDTNLMPPLPYLAPYVEDLALYLAEVDGKKAPAAVTK